MLPGNLPDVFLDTDVAFDIISKREPHFHQSIKLLELSAKHEIVLMISESCLANIIYLTFDIYKIKDGQSKLLNFLEAFKIVHAGKPEILKALRSDFKDKEDALQYYTAISNQAEYFITRNLKDYKKFELDILPVVSPEEFLK